MPLVNVEKVAQALNISPRQVQRLVDQGMPRESRGRYDLAKCLLWYVRYLQSELERRGGGLNGSDESNLRGVRTRLLQAQAEREELELARARGELVTVESFYRQLSDAFMTVRERLLNLPSKVAPDLEGESRRMIQHKLDQAVRDTLLSLAGDNGNGKHTGKANSTGGHARRTDQSPLASGSASDPQS